MRPLTDQEKAFCLRYALQDRRDPIGAYLDTFAGARFEDASIGPIVGGLLTRQDILLEIEVQCRLIANLQTGRLLVELEEARLKALREDFGAELATAITVAKGQLLGFLPMSLSPCAPSFNRADENASDFASDLLPIVTYH